ncbi:MAG TPA: LysM peptidoglycan-binding domain-containing M23 family metallopeptidase [Hyphomonadaceae bacterium]|nr:LysM peptidoglycan-binding domain-containing M23 family metallopeptidase [Hyphomonadaceae bacterium]
MISSAVAGLGACASNPPTPPVAPIDYRGAAPVKSAKAAPAPATVRQPSAPQAYVPPPPATPARTVDVGLSSTNTSAIDEAKSMQAQAGTRPGGALRQPADNVSARTIRVQDGDTLYDISRRYSVNMRALIETNNLQPPYALPPGSMVRLPPPNIHVIERGETLYSVSRRYNVDTRSLALLNGMSRPWAVWPGDELLLPPLARDQGRMSEPVVSQIPIAAAAVIAAPIAKPPVGPPAPSVKPQSLASKAAEPVAPKADTKAKVDVATVEPPKNPLAKPAASQPAPVGSHDFIWPVSGTPIKGFGTGTDGQRNDGVNIAVPQGADVKAAAGGEVVYAGNELAGFGNLILIRHPGGWVSAYAYSASMAVKEGDVVKQGQVIASAGATGNASTPQVHFELRKGKQPVDPALYLPALKG